MKKQKTHFTFDGKMITISSDLRPVVDFLMEIEKERECLLGLENRIESIRKQHQETIGLIKFLAGKLKENSIDFKYNKLSEDPGAMAGKLKLSRPVRSEFIVLFAEIEVLLYLYIAYEYKTSDKKFIIKKVQEGSDRKDFLKNFCLNPNNAWGKQYPSRIKRITTKDLWDLRNSLTHFFSVNGSIVIYHSSMEEQARKLEKESKFKITVLSPEDLRDIIKGAAELLILKWNDDCAESYSSDSNDFQDKISSVKSLVEDNGPIILTSDQISLI